MSCHKRLSNISTTPSCDANVRRSFKRNSRLKNRDVKSQLDRTISGRIWNFPVPIAWRLPENRHKRYRWKSRWKFRACNVGQTKTVELQNYAQGRRLVSVWPHRRHKSGWEKNWGSPIHTRLRVPFSVVSCIGAVRDEWNNNIKTVAQCVSSVPPLYGLHLVMCLYDAERCSRNIWTVISETWISCSCAKQRIPAGDADDTKVSNCGDNTSIWILETGRNLAIISSYRGKLKLAFGRPFFISTCLMLVIHIKDSPPNKRLPPNQSQLSPIETTRFATPNHPATHTFIRSHTSRNAWKKPPTAKLHHIRNSTIHSHFVVATWPLLSI